MKASAGTCLNGDRTPFSLMMPFASILATIAAVYPTPLLMAIMPVSRSLSMSMELVNRVFLLSFIPSKTFIMAVRSFSSAPVFQLGSEEFIKEVKGGNLTLKARHGFIT